MSNPMIYRCKKFKADGGLVDGCGWQGTAGLRHPDNCPECGSPYLRTVPIEREEQGIRSRVSQASPWYRCVITYIVCNIDGLKLLRSHEALPSGWSLESAEPIGASTFYKLEFHVLGEVSDRDGIIVRAIIGRLGMR